MLLKTVLMFHDHITRVYDDCGEDYHRDYGDDN